MNWRCLFGHDVQAFAPLYTRCVRCGQPFYTDYLESRARGATVRIPITEQEAARAIRKKPSGDPR